MKTNAKKKTKMVVNHAGAMVPTQTAEQELERIVSCLYLFEDTFYATGSDIATRIEQLLPKCRIEFVCDLAIKARTLLKMRHAPLFLMVQALKMKGSDEERNLIGETISQVISRADELAEILAIYWKVNGKDASVPRQLKAGIAKAFPKFNEYALGKYNQDGEVKLRDALFISHAKPQNKDMKKLWDKLINNKLDIPETWETMLSAGKDKKKTFTKLLEDGKLGYLALLRNLRNMDQAGVDTETIVTALIKGAKDSKALPYRFITAYKYAPAYKDALSEAMVMSVQDHPKLYGKTVVLVDVSGSMDYKLSDKSEMTRMDAASALAILLKEISDLRVFTFSDNLVEVADRKGKVPNGFKLSDAIITSQHHSSTDLAGAINTLVKHYPLMERLIVVTDEQSRTGNARLPKGTKGYIINVSPNSPALPTYDGMYTRFSGFSERILDWIIAEEMKGTK